MASELIVRVEEITGIQVIPGATALELAIIGGWQSAVKIGQFKVGDLIVYVPPDSILPGELSDRLGVTKYLDKQRVRTIKLMKGVVVSMGLIIANEGNWPKGTDVKEHYGIQKYEPPVRGTGTAPHSGYSPSQKNHPNFFKYSSPQNLRYYPDVFSNGELVVVTEKIHGSNIRTGYVNGEWMSGSHEVQRVMPLKYKYEAYTGLQWLWLVASTFAIRTYGYIHSKISFYVGLAWSKLIFKLCGAAPYISSSTGLVYNIGKTVKRLWNKIGLGKHMASFQEASIYWTPYTIPEVRKLLKGISEELNNADVIIYGELYGPGIQKLTYGVDTLSFRAFDISVNGTYLDYDKFKTYCLKYAVPTVPTLYEGPYINIDNIKRLADGNTTLGGDHIREGVVVKSDIEGTDTVVGRKILKYISNAYLAWKDGKEELDSTDI